MAQIVIRITGAEVGDVRRWEHGDMAISMKGSSVDAGLDEMDEQEGHEADDERGEDEQDVGARVPRGWRYRSCRGTGGFPRHRLAVAAAGCG